MEAKAYIFDFDGVLVNSTSYIGKGVVEFLDSFHISYPEDVVKIIMPLGYEGMAKYFHDELGLDREVNEIVEMMRQGIYYYYANEIGLKDGVIEYLHKLKESGCSINVLTASPHEIVDVCMNRLGITELFEHVWTCEDMGMKKSEPEIYEKAAHLLEKSVDEVVFFDDNIISLSTAKKAGMQTVGVYDVAGIEFEQEMKETGDRYIYSFRELEE